ncbi:uncharacterized protein N7483_000565 [Penicillium malachiteum]|uniref:uncharacterized protein n=1 Tax=Penicillium malachiteum TaxID=1324776 RepID=UPI002547AA6D|nr:uncharacterized protein N7483_000565 [Penicillium malachiteum]KAJ5735440.1 hypothetical protein N7483_000565 [Penicillium malachiteum]
MSTDQRELEYNQHSVQTTGAEGTLPANALQSYGAPVTNWATSRLYLTQQLMNPQALRHSGYSNAWGTPFSGPSEQPSMSHPAQAFAPQTSEYSSIYSPSSNFSTMVHSSTMGRLGSQEMRSEIGAIIFGRDERSLSSPWVGQQHVQHVQRRRSIYPMNMQQSIQQEESDGSSPSNLVTSLSPISTASPNYPSHSSEGAHSTPMSNMADEASPLTTGSLGEMTEEDHHTDPPYSQLIFQALSEAPDFKLQLQDIYAWFEKNTSKGKDPASKGWQNSIRHNLSMNQGFYAIKNETRGGKRTMSFWSLTAEAIRNGKVESTTRFRKSVPKKSQCADSPTRRGGGNQKGKVTGKWTELRQANRSRERQARNLVESQAPQQQQQQQAPVTIDDRYPPQPESINDRYISQPELPPYQGSPMASEPYPPRESVSFGFETVSNCIPSPHGSSPAFSDHNQPSPECLAAIRQRQALREQMGLQQQYVRSGFNPGPNNGSMASSVTHSNIQNGV